MKRLRLKRRYKIKKLNFLIGILILFFLIIFLIFGWLNKKVSPILLNYAEVETKKLSNLIINRAITKQVAKEIVVKELFDIVKNNDGEIQTIDFDPIIVNRVLSETTNLVQLYLKALEQGNIDLIEILEEDLVEYDREKLRKGIIYEIPVGVVFRNAFLSNLGPKIPVKLNLIGNVISNVNTKINQYGINNALLEVYIQIEVTEQVNLPLMSKKVTVAVDIPVALKVVQGKVPIYYQGSGIDKNSSILALPIQ